MSGQSSTVFLDKHGNSIVDFDIGVQYCLSGDRERTLGREWK